MKIWMFCVFLLCHYSLMLTSIRMLDTTTFCSSPDGIDRPLAELLYDMVMALIFIFDILNVAEGRTRFRYSQLH
jgi:hypothetical protein